MKYRQLLSWISLFVGQVATFYFIFRFLFPFKEQIQMFQFTTQYMSLTLGQAGGVCLYLSEFLSQFYIVLAAGPVITACLLTSVALLTSLILRKINQRDDLPLINLLPWLSLLIMHFDYNYIEQGTIAYLFLLLFLWLYVSLASQMRLFYGICIIPVLYLIAGPVSSLFAVTALLFEFLINGKKKYASCVFLLIAVLSAVVGTYFAWSQNLIVAFLSDAYYNPMLADSKIYYAWYALPVAMLLATYLRKYKCPVSLKGKLALEGTQWVFFLFLVWKCTFHFGGLKTLDSFKQDYYVRTEQWKAVLSEFDGNLLSKRKTCGLNLALAHEGLLSERLLDYPQRGIETLMLQWDQSVYTAELYSDLYYCMGIISASQKYAFEACVSSRSSGNPRMFKRLVETNIITGAYPVAEKYIQMLEKTWYYKEWATSFRHFLYNDEAVEIDKVLGGKRRCWIAEKAVLGMFVDPISTLMLQLPLCPENNTGLQYLTSFLLLNKDIDMYRKLLQDLYHTKAWPALSTCQQEAVVICNPDDPHFWLQHGVSTKVRNRSITFMSMVQNNANRRDLPEFLASEYGKTYWYYYMFYNE